METSLLGVQYRLKNKPDDSQEYEKVVWLTHITKIGTVSIEFDHIRGIWPRKWMYFDDFTMIYELVALPTMVPIQVFKIGTRLFAREGHSDRLTWIKE